MTLVDFPAKLRVKQRLGLLPGDSAAKLDAEIRRIDAAIAALRTAKAELLVQYREKLRKAEKVGLLVIFGALIVGHRICDQGFQQLHRELAPLCGQNGQPLRETPDALIVARRAE